VFFVCAGIVQFKVILGFTLSLNFFVMSAIMSVVFLIVVVWLRQGLRHLQYERDQHEFVQAQVQVLNHRLKDLLTKRTALLIKAQNQVALAQSRADQDAMAYGVIHDINNALLSIKLSWNLLKEALDNELTELKASMNAGLTQAMNITHDFMFFLRPNEDAHTEGISVLTKLVSFLSQSLNHHQRLSFNVVGLEDSSENISISPSSDDASFASSRIYVKLSGGQLVKRAGGSIELESELEVGTIFMVNLPLSTVPTDD